MIEGEIVYGSHQYVHYDEIFQADGRTHQLLLFEGNVVVGKTTFKYNVLKVWAERKVLQQYVCIVLVELCDLKPGTLILLETIFALMDQSSNNEICTEISRTNGKGILIWLEGWDELDGSFVYKSIIKDLLSGRMLP